MYILLNLFKIIIMIKIYFKLHLDIIYNRTILLNLKKKNIGKLCHKNLLYKILLLKKLLVNTTEPVFYHRCCLFNKKNNNYNNYKNILCTNSKTKNYY